MTDPYGTDPGTSPFREPSTKTYKVVTIWTAVAAALALASVAILASQAENPFSVFATGTIVAAASAFTGALFGFIFGVPRVLASDQPQARGSGISAPIVANTNLEQISDWLTKILVGIGLTQFSALVQAAGMLFAGLAPSFGGGDVGRSFAGGLVLYMVTFGFSTGWLFTRLFLGRAMAAADRDAAVLQLMDLADKAEQAGNSEEARIYRSQARDILKPTPAVIDGLSATASRPTPPDPTGPTAPPDPTEP